MHKGTGGEEKPHLVYMIKGKVCGCVCECGETTYHGKYLYFYIALGSVDHFFRLMQLALLMAGKWLRVRVLHFKSWHNILF